MRCLWTTEQPAISRQAWMGSELLFSFECRQLTAPADAPGGNLRLVELTAI